MRITIFFVALLCSCRGGVGEDVVGIVEHRKEIEPENEELRLGRLFRLSYDGDNGEAYFSPDGEQLVFQSTRPPFTADQIFTIPIVGGEPRLISTGKGRTTCSYFLDPGRAIFASTHHRGDEPPPPPDRSQGYVWKMHREYDLFVKDLATDELEQWTDGDGYDAEATVSPDGTKVVFTYLRDGNPDLYVMDVATRNVRRITNSIEYEGGAFFSWDSRTLVYRASLHSTIEETRAYLDALSQNLIKPGVFEIFVCNADGSGKRQVTNLGATSFAPSWHPSDRKIVFMSNTHDPKSHQFEIYLIDADGANLERVTFHPTFDGFPMFSPDGKHLAFCSNRDSKDERETHIFLAEWRETIMK